MTDLTYEVKPHGKKFETVCRTDGYCSISFLSKNKKLAHRKGREFLSGTRTSYRKYVPRAGRERNEKKSRAVIAHRHESKSILPLLAVAFLGFGIKENDND